MMTWLDTRKGVSQSRTESSLHNTYDTSIRVYFTDKYTDYPLFGVMYAHARAMYTSAFSPKKSGLESRLDGPSTLHYTLVMHTFIMTL